MATSKTFLPREHGAWVQLALPLLGALLPGSPTAAAGCMTAAVTLGFLAHEPLLIALGHRGKRALDLQGRAAWRRFVVLGLAAVGFGVAAAVLASPTARLAALGFVVPAALVAPLLLRRRERSTGFEVGVSVALAGAAPMVAVASGLSPRIATLHGLLWATTFAAETLSARGVLAMSGKRARSRRLLVWATVVALAGLGGAIAAFAAGVAGGALVWAAAPVVPVTAYVLWRPPHAKQLFAVGVAMAVTGTLSLVALLVGPV